MEKGIQIRPATPADAGDVAELLGQLGYPQPGGESERLLRRVVDWPGQAVLVAEGAGRVVAVMQLGYCPTLGEAQYAEIRSLVTDARFRRQGLGARLVEAAAAWARAQGIARLRVRCNRVRDQAHRFYRRAGFEALKVQTVFEREP